MAESTQPNMFGIKDYAPDKTLRNIDDPIAYEVRKIQMAIRSVDRELYRNPSKINLPAYLDLLKAHTEKMNILKKTDYFAKKRGAKNDTEAVVEEVSFGEDEAGIGEEVSVGVDTGISAHDTFTP